MLPSVTTLLAERQDATCFTAADLAATGGELGLGGNRVAVVAALELEQEHAGGELGLRGDRVVVVATLEVDDLVDGGAGDLGPSPASEMLLQGPRSLGKSIGSARDDVRDPRAHDGGALRCARSRLPRRPPRQTSPARSTSPAVDQAEDLELAAIAATTELAGGVLLVDLGDRTSSAPRSPPRSTSLAVNQAEDLELGAITAARQPSTRSRTSSSMAAAAADLAGGGLLLVERELSATSLPRSSSPAVAGGPYRKTRTVGASIWAWAAAPSTVDETLLRCSCSTCGRASRSAMCRSPVQPRSACRHRCAVSVRLVYVRKPDEYHGR